MTHRPIIRDRRYLNSLRNERCVITGLYGSENDPVEPCHIGTAGKSLKSSDDEALPVLHSYHALGHQHGEVFMFRKHAPDSLLREALRAYARELYIAAQEEG